MLYTDIDTLKGFLGIEGPDKDDYLEQLIVQGTALVDIELGDNLETKSITRRIDGNGTNRIVMENSVVSVESVRVARDSQVLEVDFIDGPIVYLTSDAPRGIKNIEISYTKGYDAVPADFSRFFLQYCRELDAMQQTASTETVKSKRLGDLSLTFFAPSELKDERFLADLGNVIGKYRNFSIH